jgi:hypothetical protein
MDQNDLFWDIDTTNLNAIYRKYKPSFEKLDLKDDKDVKKSVQYFKEIARDLVDGHYSINFLNKA